MKIVLDNEQNLADINSKISQAQLNFKYQELRAPVSGTIFDLQAKNPGFVANPTQKLLQIVPNDNYVAEVFITNRDIGFVREKMAVDVRIDSFPFSEFGDIKGTVEKIASDALPPDETYQFYRFPARIRLDKQYLDIKNKKIPLQSGMSLSANIKVREERTVMSLFTELFTNQVESLKEVR
jgi:HlyD family secretion protein